MISFREKVPDISPDIHPHWWRSTPPSPELLRHAPSHLIQFFILQHSSRTGTKRCSALKPIFCSTLPTEQVLRVFHEVNPLDLRTIRGATSETWEKHNMKKLDRSQKKIKAGETNLWREDCKWSQMLALFWKQLVQHFGSECESEQWMMLLQSEKKKQGKSGVLRRDQHKVYQHAESTIISFDPKSTETKLLHCSQISRYQRMSWDLR